MKKCLILSLYFLTFPAFSQVKGISYQAVILHTQELPGADHKAAALSDQNICLKFQFSDANNTNEYEEIIFTKTDLYGMVNVVIGKGERIGGSSASFGEIEWSLDRKFLDVSLDKAGLGANFKAFSRQEFTAVPFALFAANSGNTTAGIQGIQGETGIQGTIGITGNQGIQGIQGEIGNQGLKGEKGDAGKVGMRGLQGLDGVAGNQGIQGVQGEIGTQGLAGAKGETGALGLPGLQGAIGVAGIQGIQGITGDPGIKGAQGEKGDSGKIGIKGLQGTDGVAGTQGIQGVPGEIGTRGLTGEKGDPGKAGLRGLQGLDGVAGNQGIQGIQGDVGTQGLTGAKGVTGDVGLTGLQGTIGVAGNQGIQGVPGPSGIAASSASFVDLSTDQTVEGNKTFARPIWADISGNAATTTTNANLTGAVTSVGNATSLANGAVTDPKLDKANIPLSGFGVAVADVDLGANKLTGIADPISAQDAATKNYVDKPYVINAITESDLIMTTSTQNLLVEGMTFTPDLGTYLVLFNGQMISDPSFSSAQGDLDVVSLYTALMAVPVQFSHAAAFGNETLLPGVYDIASALSIAGTLTLDGQNDPTSLFIIRSTGAMTAGTSTEVVLINGATANNVFWVSEGAISTTNPTIMKGILIANQAAVSLGANTSLEGRMFAITGALSMGAGSSLTVPTGASGFDLGILSSFAMYTGIGDVSCVDCLMNGDVGTGSGDITGFSNSSGIVYPAGSLASNPSITTYGLYQNGVEILHSSRSTSGLNALVSLQAMVTITTEDTPIEIYWKVDTGSAKIGTRNLSLVRLGN